MERYPSVKWSANTIFLENPLNYTIGIPEFEQHWHISNENVGQAGYTMGA